MPTAGDGARDWDRCLTSTDLTRAESTGLAALPLTVGRVPHTVTCELAAGHDGSHLAFTVAVHGGERWWWLHWTVDLRILVEAEVCDRTIDNSPDRDDCLLPKDHPGPHSFEIAASC
jgi:hypothetical protein